MTVVDELDAAAGMIRQRAPAPPEVAIILGSGMGEALAPSGAVEIPYGEIPGFVRSGVEGHAGLLVLGTVGGRSVAVMRGRFHYYEGHDMARVVFPVRALRRAGAGVLLMTSAAGSLRREWPPGALVLIRDHINWMGANPLRGPNPEGLGPRFPDLTRAYDPELRRLVRAEARRLRLRIPEGVYVATGGPSYETPAEIRAARRLGADLVGMSVVPEVIAAVHAGMRVAAIACVSNYAAGIARRPLSHEEVIEVTGRIRERLGRLLERVIPKV